MASRRAQVLNDYYYEMLGQSLIAVDVIAAAALAAVVLLFPLRRASGVVTTIPDWGKVGTVPALLDQTNTDSSVFPPAVGPVPLDATHWRFDYPAALGTGGRFSGADLRSRLPYPLTLFFFDATFVSDPLRALAFDEMAVFCTSTLQYNGTEFGVRCDLKSGLVFGYTQEGSPSFQQFPLIVNDRLPHQYLIILGGGNSQFFVDGVFKGLLTLAGGHQYSSSSPYWLTALAHRYSSGWDSTGYRMDAGNFNLF